MTGMRLKQKELEALIEQATHMTPVSKVRRYTLPELERKSHLDFLRTNKYEEQQFYHTVLNLGCKQQKKQILHALYQKNYVQK